MTGLLVVLLAVGASLAGAAALRLSSLVSTLLAAYLALVVNAVGITVALSPLHAVRAVPLALSEGAVLVAASGAWWWRGRPVPRLSPAARAVREVLASPLALLFLVVMAATLGYELLLALTVPPNNWDSLTYHLARTAAWAQHGGYFWIPNAPTDRMNVFQPLAEQQILFLFAAFRTSRLFAVPQYLAELAIVLAVYGSARRLGFEVRVAACCAALLTTFSLVALESTTAQNDLVAASFPVVAACLILGGSTAEVGLAGAALGIGLGAKLSTAFVWPVLALLVWTLGRRAVLWGAAGACAGFVLVGWWGYWLNLVHTGHILGPGFGKDVGASPPISSSPRTVVHVLRRLLDASVLSDRLIGRLALAGLAAGVLVGAIGYRRRGARKGLLLACAVAIPLAAPLVVLALGSEPDLNRRANEDYSAFGPVGALMLLGTPLLTIGLYAARRVDVRFLALALALPVFLVLLGLQLAYNPYLTRFLIVPAVLTAPLFGLVLRSHVATAALLAVSTLAVFLTLEYDRTKPYRSQAGHPWHLTQAEALQYVFEPAVQPAYTAYERRVPARACVGAVLSTDEPSYLLWGRNRTRRVFFLTSTGSLEQALAAGVFYVVIDARANTPVADQFRSAGWSVGPLGDYWLLAKAPHAGNGACS